MKLSGWGRFPRAECTVVAPRDVDDLLRQTAGAESLIPRGNGRSYGDPALNEDCTLELTGLSRLLAFDADAGLLTAEAGVLLRDVLEVFVPRGWFPVVTPGTKYVTLGGMAAADVHGKNHHRDGSFGQHVAWLDLLTADGQILRCDRTQNTELFDATIGGMGLTGVILRLCVRLRRVETAYIRQRTLVAPELDAALEAFDETDNWTYSVAWIDTLARGSRLGRSILSVGEHAGPGELPADKSGAPLAPAARMQFSVPVTAPPYLLNRATARAFNTAYFHRQAAIPGEAIVDADRYFYPLDGLRNWNLLYGPGGFTQYQVVLPLERGREGLVQILERVARSEVGAFLSVLKRFGPQDGGLLSFPMAGYTLAMDFPVSARTFDLLLALDGLVVRYGGRLYLAKDARMGAATLRAGYPHLDRFRRIRAATGADRRYHSLLTRRLDL